MVPDPTPPYRAPDFCPDGREKFLAVVDWIAPALESTLSPAPPEPTTATLEETLRRAGISSERQAAYQRRMSSLLVGRGDGLTAAGFPPEEQLSPWRDTGSWPAFGTQGMSATH
jgi:hypothetical protein